MSGGTRSFEMAKRLVSRGHEVNMITSWRTDHQYHDWFTTCDAGICTHWLPVPYSNEMSYRRRVVAFLTFAMRATKKAASLPADVIFATSTPLTICLPGAYASWKQAIPMVFEV